EHLFEMRDEPSLVDGIAGEAAAEMIVNAALAYVGQRFLDRGLCVIHVVPNSSTPQEPQEAPLRELRRAMSSAVDRINRTDHAASQLLQQVVGDLDVACGGTVAL